MPSPVTDGDLANIESALQALSLNKSDSAAISTLANASRESVEVRKQLADPQALQTLIDVIDTSITNSVESLELALRCLGNACANNNDARDAVTRIGFDWAVRSLDASDETTQALVVKVLYNICNEHEASQQALYHARVHNRVIRFLSQDSTKEDEASKECGVDLLFWITGHKAALEPNLSHQMPMDILQMLLKLPESSADTDVETFGCIVESVLAFLRDDVVQKQITTDLALFTNVRDILAITTAMTRSIQATEGSDLEDLRVLQPLETSLLWILSDCAAQAEGDDAVTLCEAKCLHFVKLIRQDAGLEESGVLLSASCQELGNLIRKVEPHYWSYLVERHRLDTWLYNRVLQANQSPEDVMLLHSVSGLLIQLTRASQHVREVMVDNDNGSLAALELLCRHEMPQVRDAGVQLLKRLGSSPANQERLAPLGREVMARLKDESQDAKKVEDGAT